MSSPYFWRMRFSSKNGVPTKILLTLRRGEDGPAVRLISVRDHQDDDTVYYSHWEIGRFSEFFSRVPTTGFFSSVPEPSLMDLFPSEEWINLLDNKEVGTLEAEIELGMAKSCFSDYLMLLEEQTLLTNTDDDRSVRAWRSALSGWVNRQNQVRLQEVGA